MKKINVIDLFAGCGGLSEGFMKAGGFNFCGFVEWNKASCETLIHNLKNKWKDSEAEKKVIRFDIQKTKELLFGWNEESGYPPHYYSKSGISEMTKRFGKIDMIIGGPPCQAYSVAGRIRDEHGMVNDYRNYLFESYIKIVSFFKPDIILFENVPGILSAKPGGELVTDRIKKSFNAHGYEIIDNIRKYAVLNSVEYGVPQNRRRVILIGLNKNRFDGKIQNTLVDFYVKILPKLKSRGFKTVRESIGDLPKFFPISSKDKKFSYQPKNSSVPNHFPRFHNERDIKIFKELATDSKYKNRKYPDVSALKKLYTERTGRASSLHKYHVLSWDEPSTTIVAHLHKDGLRHIHPDFKQARSITVREAARLQSFDDNFVFMGNQSEQFIMVGDAVPPLFSKSIANGIKELFSKHSN